MSTASSVRTSSSDRENFVVNRQSEFFSTDEFIKQIGHQPDWWRTVLVAELIDNALDHCEEKNILPEITVTFEQDAITVEDNGLGIPASVVESMLNYETRSSSRVGYVCPTRGAQGNASKCLLAMPYIVNGKIGRVEIDAQGKLHVITTKLDVLKGTPDISKTQEIGKVQNGTFVKVHIPSSLEADLPKIEALIRGYALLNKHATFRLVAAGQTLEWDRTVLEIRKWTAKNDDPSHWHDGTTLQDLILKCIQADLRNGKSRTIGEFIKQFGGMKRSEDRGEVLHATGLLQFRLDALVANNLVDRARIDRLLEAMQEVTKAPDPLKLGYIGKEHIEASTGEKVKYKRITGTRAGGLPFVVEAAFFERADIGDRMLTTGVNFSVDVNEPSIAAIKEILEECRVDEDSPVDVLVHITTPRAPYTNRGKTQLSICVDLEEAIRKAIEKVTSEFTRDVKAQERDSDKYWRQQARKERESSMTLRDAIFKVMKESIDQVSQNDTCDFSARSHYYAVRALIQKYTDRPLDQKHLDRTIDEWEMIHGIIKRRMRDPRGFLLEPHTGKQIPLGTREVEGYEIPQNLYHTILYVEKKGLLPNFQYGQIAEKYDCAIIFSEGFAVRAAQSLMQIAANGHAMKVFVFHDADPAGYGIAKAIGNRSGAHKFDFEVIDVGLKLEEALAMDLPTEDFIRKNELPSSIELTETERRLFTGTPAKSTGNNGQERTLWTGCKRVELNALAANPKRFVEWVEKKLDEHGATRKLIPSSEVIRYRGFETYMQERRAHIKDYLISSIDIEGLVDEIDSELPKPSFDDLAKEIQQWGLGTEPVSWANKCDELAMDRLDLIDTQGVRLTMRRLTREHFEKLKL